MLMLPSEPTKLSCGLLLKVSKDKSNSSNLIHINICLIFIKFNFNFLFTDVQLLLTLGLSIPICSLKLLPWLVYQSNYCFYAIKEGYNILLIKFISCCRRFETECQRRHLTLYVNAGDEANDDQLFCYTILPVLFLLYSASPMWTH